MYVPVADIKNRPRIHLPHLSDVGLLSVAKRNFDDVVPGLGHSAGVHFGHRGLVRRQDSGHLATHGFHDLIRRLDQICLTAKRQAYREVERVIRVTAMQVVMPIFGSSPKRDRLGAPC